MLGLAAVVMGGIGCFQSAQFTCCYLAGVSAFGLYDCGGHPDGYECGIVYYRNAIVMDVVVRETGTKSYTADTLPCNCQYYVYKCKNGTCTPNTAFSSTSYTTNTPSGAPCP